MDVDFRWVVSIKIETDINSLYQGYVLKIDLIQYTVSYHLNRMVVKKSSFNCIFHIPKIPEHNDTPEMYINFDQISVFN